MIFLQTTITNLATQPTREIMKKAQDSMSSPFGFHDIDGFYNAE
jgi:hypothetical protein